jgi:hypothetical protein
MEDIPGFFREAPGFFGGVSMKSLNPNCPETQRFSKHLFIKHTMLQFSNRLPCIN